MKLSNIFRRTGALAVAGLMAAGGLWATLRADAVDIESSTAGFSNPTITHTNINKWVEGVPDVTSDTKGQKIPVLMTWEEKYYMKVSHEFAVQMDNHVGDDYSGEEMMNGWSDDDDDSGYVNGDFDADGQYPHGSFRQNMGYPGALLSSLDKIDYSLLTKNGYFYTLGEPDNVPYLVPVGGKDSSVHFHKGDKVMTKNPVYLIEVDIPDWDSWYGAADYVGNFDYRGGLRRGENYLIGLRRNKLTHWTQEESFLGIPYTEHYLACGWYWTLYGLNNTTMQNLKNNRDWTRSFQPSMTDWNNLKSRGTSADYKFYFGWYVASTTQNNKKYYCFWTPGTRFNGQPYETCDELSDYSETVQLISLDAKIGLSHYGGNFESRGNWNGDDVQTAFYLYKSNCQYAFRCFYAQPYQMNYAQTSFTVEKGQVYNLGGPMVIGPNCVITVKEGGTLIVNGWVINNGQIVVNQGGTLYLQDDSCMCRYNDGGSSGGSVMVYGGLVLVGKNAKLIGGGWDGLFFGEGSKAVNFGCIAAETFVIRESYTIENRGDGFVLSGAGNGVLYAGNILYATPLVPGKKTFGERGSVDTYPYVRFADNAVYQGGD